MKAIKKAPFYALMTITRVESVFLRGVDALHTQRQKPSPWQVLLSFENQDLGNLNQQSARAVHLHWNGEARPYDEDKPEAERVSSLRSRDSVRKVLAELSQSPNSWIQTAAEAMLKINRQPLNLKTECP